MSVGARIDRRRFLAALVASSSVARSIAAAPKPKPAIAAPTGATVRLSWPMPATKPDPFSLRDLSASLVGAALYVPLYARAVDGVVEPRGATGAPHEVKTGTRVDLGAGLTASDAVASILAAKTAGARLWLHELPSPRVDGEHGIVFTGVTDLDLVMHKLASPLVRIARAPTKATTSFGETGPFELVAKEGIAAAPIALRRRPKATDAARAPATLRPIDRFELTGGVEIAEALRMFERGDSELGWLGDGLYFRRTSCRSMDLGALGYVALRAGSLAPSLKKPGALASRLQKIDRSRLAHLGLLQRGHVAPSAAEIELIRAMPTPTALPPRAEILVPSTSGLLVAAAEIVARELECSVRAVDEATLDRALRDDSFAIAIDVVRAIDETLEGVAASLATFAGHTTLPASGTTAVGLSLTSSAALGWEIALLGAQAGDVWIPRAAGGGLDIDGGAVGRRAP